MAALAAGVAIAVVVLPLIHRAPRGANGAHQSPTGMFRSTL